MGHFQQQTVSLFVSDLEVDLEVRDLNKPAPPAQPAQPHQDSGLAKCVKSVDQTGAPGEHENSCYVASSIKNMV